MIQVHRACHGFNVFLVIEYHMEQNHVIDVTGLSELYLFQGVNEHTTCIVESHVSRSQDPTCSQILS